MDSTHETTRDVARRVVPVAVAFTLGTALYATDIYALAPGPTGTPLPVRFAVLALLSATLYFRRTAPMVAVASALVPFGVDLAMGPTLPVWLVASDLVYALALYGGSRQSRAAVGVAAAGSALGVGIVLVLTHESRYVVLAIAAAAAFLGTPVWWARSIRGHKEMASMERDRAAALAAVAELDRQAAVDEERARMARDLHDVIAGHLSAIALQSEAAVRVLGTDAALPILRSIRTNSTDALDEMKSMIGLLREKNPSESLLAPGRLTELGALVQSARMTGADVAVRSAIGTGILPAAVDHTAFRIAQEALTNATKHAPTESVSVDIDEAGDVLTLTISNSLPDRTHDGDPTLPHSPRAGLSNMRERAALLGGTFEAGRAGSRWTVEASLPLVRRSSGGAT